MEWHKYIFSEWWFHVKWKYYDDIHLCIFSYSEDDSCGNIYSMRPEVLTAVAMKISHVGLMQCNLIKIYQSFGGTSYLIFWTEQHATQSRIEASKMLKLVPEHTALYPKRQW